MFVSDFVSYLYPREEKTFLGEMQKDFEQPEGFWSLAVTPLSKILSWADYVFGGLYSPLREYKSLMGRIGTFGTIMGLPDKLDKAIEAISEWKDAFFKGISWDLGVKTTDAYVETVGSISIMADSVGLGRDLGLLSLSDRVVMALDFVGFMGSLALFLSSVKGLFEHGHDFLSQEIGSPEFKLAMMKLAGKMMLIAMSIFGMVTFAVGGVTDRLILLSLSTVVLLLSILSKYYKKAYIAT